MVTPWQTALDLPTYHNLAVDLVDHLNRPGVVLSTPEFFLMAHEIDVPHGTISVEQRRILSDPATRHPGGNCWVLLLVTGDAMAAYFALVSACGSKEWVAWESKTGIHIRKTGPKLQQFLKYVQSRTNNARRGPQAFDQTRNRRPDAGILPVASEECASS